MGEEVNLEKRRTNQPDQRIFHPTNQKIAHLIDQKIVPPIEQKIAHPIKRTVTAKRVPLTIRRVSLRQRMLNKTTMMTFLKLWSLIKKKRKFRSLSVRCKVCKKLLHTEDESVSHLKSKIHWDACVKAENTTQAKKRAAAPAASKDTPAEKLLKK